MWERVNLSEVGIPPPTPQNSSKVVFTTRSIKVCGQMEADEKIEVQCLADEKTWELFQDKVGEQTLDSDPSIREMAREVAKKCGGLPLALNTIGRTMACKKRVEDWQYAIEVLRRPSTSVFQDLSEQVYPLLKFSYESLPNDMFRTCLLYCSLFPEDFEIEKDDIIDYWIGEGFLDGDSNASLARNQGHHIISSHVHAYLLEEVDAYKIKMHDVIRDMSLWIACKCEEGRWKFFVQARCYLTKAPEVGKGRSIRVMSLMDNKIEDLEETLDWPDLQTLFLRNNKLKVINNDFFLFVSGLKVLDLSRNFDLTKLPVGISKLVSLEYLNLSRTRIRELPIELKALKKLKCLILELLYGSSTRIPRKLIPYFSKLQVLRMLNCDYTWGRKANESFMEELKCLHCLNVLSISITSAFHLDRFLSNDRLCGSTVHASLELFNDSKCLNMLPLANIKGLKSLDLVNCHLEEVKIEWIKAQSHIQASVIAREHCFHSLRKVYISLCPELREVTWLILAPNLKVLTVNLCQKMEEIINKRKLSQVAEPELVDASSIFPKLEELHLMRLPELEGIYQDALPFSCLKQISVSGCRKLKRLLLDSNSARENKIRVTADKRWWNELQWEDKSILNAFDQPV